MLRFVDADQLPKEFGGTATYSMDNSPLELAFRNFVAEQNKKPPANER